MHVYKNRRDSEQIFGIFNKAVNFKKNLKILEHVCMSRYQTSNTFFKSPAAHHIGAALCTKISPDVHFRLLCRGRVQQTHKQQFQ